MAGPWLARGPSGGGGDALNRALEGLAERGVVEREGGGEELLWERALAGEEDLGGVAEGDA